MKKIYTEPKVAPTPQPVISQANQEHQLADLFQRGWNHLINQHWQKAEAIFAQIEAYNSHYELDGMRASTLRRRAQYERIAQRALETGELETALRAFKKAEDFENAKEVHELLSIQELENRAEQATQQGEYQQAAWIYHHLIDEHPEHEREATWQIKKESCWEAELMPFFLLGVQSLEQSQWRAAYRAFSQVLAVDPYFRKDGRSAAGLSEIARKEVVLLADQMLRQGQVQQALNIYREVGHLARIENVTEFLRLRQREEDTAAQLEADGHWQDAASKYTYLATLYYDENGRSKWQTAAKRCQENQKLHTLYDQAMTAWHKKRWGDAAHLLGQILRLAPEFDPGEEPLRKLYRAARWRSLAGQFLSQTNSPPPQINTGNLS
ncbi:MAG: hypothetical protein R3D55_15800 [Chloroflexota bacterium]